MTDEEKKLNQSQLDIAVIKVQVDAILKKQDDVMIVVKDELSRMRESYTNQIRSIEVECARNRIERKEKCAEHQKALDENINRIINLEKQQDISNVKLGGIVLIMTTIFTIIANFVWDAIVKK